MLISHRTIVSFLGLLAVSWCLYRMGRSAVAPGAPQWGLSSMFAPPLLLGSSRTSSTLGLTGAAVGALLLSRSSRGIPLPASLAPLAALLSRASSLAAEAACTAFALVTGFLLYAALCSSLATAAVMCLAWHRLDAAARRARQWAQQEWSQPTAPAGHASPRAIQPSVRAVAGQAARPATALAR